MTTRRVSYATRNEPIKQIRHDNGRGYNDLILHKNKKGTAVFISDKFGESRVKVNLTTLKAFLADVALIAKTGANTAISAVDFAA